MKFRTEIEIAKIAEGIDHTQKVFALGSCFAENISERLAKAKFSVESNPFGVLFNPFSIANALERLDEIRAFAVCDIKAGRDAFFSFDAHSSLDGKTHTEIFGNLNKAVAHGSKALRESDWGILTFGTAWVYEKDGRVVANCHKQPAAQFSRRKMSVEEIVERFCALIDGVLKGKRILFTVSPIRHLKDGLAENSLSKATLRVAIDELCRRYPDRCHYFPAYELLVDDLRDYRFYAEDMLPPSKQAVDYVWRKFAAATMDGHTLEGVEAAERYGRMVAHRIVDPTSPATAQFLENRYREREKLLLRWPGISLPSDE